MPAISESGGEEFEELSLTVGLLAWLAWEVDIDVRAAVERTSPLDLEEEEPPWYGIQLLAAIAAPLSGDEAAQETLASAVTSTARKGANVASWLRTHLQVADRLAHVISDPQNVAKVVRAPIPGDLIILGPAFEPRVRIALEVGPYRGSGKITVLDPDDDDDKRQFLSSHVGYAPLFAQEPTSKRVAGF